MSVPAQSAIFSMALQPSKIGNGTINTAGLNWFRSRAPQIGVTPQDLADVFPLETGGPIVPTGAYKMGLVNAGDVEFVPRLERFIGLVLYGVMGRIQSEQNKVWDKATNSFVNGPTGIYSHRFTFDPDRPFFQPWLAVRVHVPGATPDKSFGMLGVDFKISSVVLNIPAMGLLGMTVGFLGRRMEFPLAADVNAWSYENTNESHVSAPLSNKGTFLINGEPQPIVQATVEITNEMDDPRNQFVVGSEFMDDVISLTRNVQFRVVYKWNNPDFYRKILTNGVNNVDWSLAPFVTDTVGSTKSLEIRVESPTNIPGSSPATPYSLSIYGNRVFWQIDRQGVRLQAGTIIMVPYVGRLLEPEEGVDYVEAVLVNNAAYTIPVDPNAPVLTFATSASINAAGDVILDPAATITDNDPNFEYGLLNLVFRRNSDFDKTRDRITFDSSVTINTNNEVVVSSTVIGTITGGAPAVGQNLGITFNANATPARVQTLLRALRYTTTAINVGDVVRLALTVADGNGGFVTREIAVTHTN